MPTHSQARSMTRGASIFVISGWVISIMFNKSIIYPIIFKALEILLIFSHNSMEYSILSADGREKWPGLGECAVFAIFFR